MLLYFSVTTKITASDGTAGDQFSYSVAISGDYIIVGARGNDNAGSWSGSAYIFKRDGTEWTEQAKITASDGAEDDLFGTSVAISGDYAVVGADGDDDAGSNSGSAYIFKRYGTIWTEQAKITASDGAAGDRFSDSVAISGDYVVVGAYRGDSAYIFKRYGTIWTEQAKINASDGAADDEFGDSVAISDDYVVVGAYGDDDAGPRSGSAYIYDIPDTTAPPLNITSFAPPSPVADTEGAARTFRGHRKITYRNQFVSRTPESLDNIE